MSKTRTSNGKKGGLLEGKPHYDKDGNSLGGIKAVVTDAGGKPVELEGGEVIINKEASKKYWKELSKINQSAGNGVPILPPDGAVTDEDPEEFSEGGNIIEFNPNHLPNKWITEYAKQIKRDHPEIWKKGGNIFGNEAFVNLCRVRERGHWLDSEEWMYIKWRSYVARHKKDFRIEGVVAMLKWCDKVEKGWGYMKTLIEKEIATLEKKKKPSAFRQAIKEKSLFKDGGKVSKTKDSCQVLDKNGNPAIDDKSLRKMEKCIMKLTQTKDMNLNANGKYKLARRKLHKKIIDEFKKNAVCITEGQPIAILMGGSPASGKSSFLRKYRPFLLQEEILKVDADEIRAKLPEYKGYNATQTHQETKDIVTTLISDRNIGVPCDFDLIYDGTMNNVRSYKPLIELLRSRNYKIFIVYMDKVPKEVIMQRMKERYLKTGRFVPAEVVDDFFKKGTSAFEELKPLVDGYLVIDGSNQDYNIIEKGGMQLPEDRAYSKLGQKISAEELEKIEYKRGGNLDKIDSVELDIPLLIRVLEFAREDIKSDPELHHVVERLIEIRDKGVLTMEDYDFIADLKKKEKFSEIERKYANGGTVLLAPNGKPSKLTPKQHKLVRTPEFKAWFGDWENDPENASKVVDENGEPLVIYHNSGAKFNVFDKSKNKLSIYGEGLYFTNIENEYNKKGKYSYQVFLNLKTPLIIDLENKNYEHDIHELLNFEREFELGAIIKNPPPRPSDVKLYGFGERTYYIAYNSNQIKLADGTNTTFDPNNDDIRFEKGGLLAPNGNRSNLTPEQHKLVRTPEFKAWFGDWENDPENASKVVDENGEPLVVYNRGKVSFNVFDSSKQLNGWLGKGFYFSESKNEFKEYGNKLIVAFLNLKKPFVVKGESPTDFLYEIKKELNSDDSDTTQLLKNNNFDGVIYKHWDYESRMFTCFEPNQIKLADGTNTTFDPNNDDIRFETGGAVLLAPNGNPSNLKPEQHGLVRTPAFKKWFGDWENDPENASKVVDENGEPKVVWRGESKEFNKFDYKKLGSQLKTAWRKAGFYFSPTKVGAEQYMIFMRSDILKQFFLNIKNPNTLDSNEFYGVMDWGSLPKQRFKTNKSATDYANSQVEKMKIDNYDGFFVTDLETEDVYEIVAFNPNQIKLADGTNTTFDPNNDDIRFDDGGEIKIDEIIFKVKIYLEEHSYDRETDTETPMWFCRVIKMNENDVDGILTEDNDLEGLNIGNFDSRKKARDFLLRYSEKLNVILLDDNGIGYKFFNSNNADIRFEKGGEVDLIYGEIYSGNQVRNIVSKYSSQEGTDMQEFAVENIKPKDKYVLDFVNVRFLIENDTNLHSFISEEYEPNNKVYYQEIKNPILLGYDKWDNTPNVVLDGYHRVLQALYNKQDQILAFINFKTSEKIRYFKTGGSISKTPAPSKERIYGSEKNKPRSSKDSSSAETIKFDEKTLTSIENKLKEHNESHPDVKVNLATAKAVVRRGMGAYSKSHRPTISGGKPNSRVAWGLARLNAFLYKAVHGESKSGKYSQDNDLLDELSIAHDKFADGGTTEGGEVQLNSYREFNEYADKLPKFGYHGTQSATLINPRPSKEGRYGEGLYLTLNPNTAEYFGKFTKTSQGYSEENKSANVFEFDLRGLNLKYYTKAEDMPYIDFDGLRQKNYDGIYLYNEGEIVIFNIHKLPKGELVRTFDGTKFDGNNPNIRFENGGNMSSDDKITRAKQLLSNSFDYLEDPLELLGKGFFGMAFLTVIDGELWVAKYTRSLPEFWLSQMAMVSNPPHIVTIKEVKELSDNFEYGIIHKYTDTDGVPNKAVWNVAIGITFKEYLEAQKSVPPKEKEYVKNLAIKLKKEVQDYFGVDAIDTSQSNWGYEDGKLVLFDIDGEVKRSQYEEWMQKYSAPILKKGGVIEVKQKQLEIIKSSNPAPNNYNTWIRTAEDIKTAEEVFSTAFEEGAMYPDFQTEDMSEALESGYVTIYSSYPIKEGVFVTPSKMNALDYAGGNRGKVFSKKVQLKDIAWIDESEGQYAPTESFKTGGEIPKKKKNGNCYEKAGKMILYANTKPYSKIDYIGKPYLVHAQVTGQGAIEGVKYGHAWIEDDAFVYDYSNKRELKVPKALYYQIGQIIEQQPIHFKYTFEEARRKMNETGHYGSWDLITESGL